MNRPQHIFIWIGIILLMLIAIKFESKPIWLIPAIGLIGECVYLCKDIVLPKGNIIESIKAMPLRFWILLFCIIIFIIIFLIATQEEYRGLPPT